MEEVACALRTIDGGDDEQTRVTAATTSGYKRALGKDCRAAAASLTTV